MKRVPSGLSKTDHWERLKNSITKCGTNMSYKYVFLTTARPHCTATLMVKKQNINLFLAKIKTCFRFSDRPHHWREPVPTCYHSSRHWDLFVSRWLSRIHCGQNQSFGPRSLWCAGIWIVTIILNHQSSTNSSSVWGTKKNIHFIYLFLVKNVNLTLKWSLWKPS